jgi:hypothetical protein
MHTSISIAIVGPKGSQGLGGALGNYGSFTYYNLTPQSFDDSPRSTKDEFEVLVPVLFQLQLLA